MGWSWGCQEVFFNDDYSQNTVLSAYLSVFYEEANTWELNLGFISGAKADISGIYMAQNRC